MLWFPCMGELTCGQNTCFADISSMKQKSLSLSPSGFVCYWPKTNSKKDYHSTILDVIRQRSLIFQEPQS